MRRDHPHSSRQRYRVFVDDYRHRQLDEKLDAEHGKPAEQQATDVAPRKALGLARFRGGKGRQYLREYFRWLRPHRSAVAGVFVLALTAAGLQMIEPLFMRFIIDRVLLNNTLDASARLARLNMAGALFVTVIIPSGAYAPCDTLQVRITSATSATLFGTPVENTRVEAA